MSEPMSSHEIEDVLASIRRLVSDDLRPANRPSPIGKLLLTPALRVVPKAGVVDNATDPLDRAQDPIGETARAGSVRDQSTLTAVSDQNADHLDFGSPPAMGAAQQAPAVRSAMQMAADSFHAQADEFILSYSDTGAVMLRGDAPESPLPADHGAVFAVLNRATGVPPMQLLVDAEGGAPVEDDTSWSTVEWDDAPADPETAPDVEPVGTASGAPPLRAEVMQDDGAKDGPLILSFVSARRPSGGAGADVLRLRSPLVQKMGDDENRSSEDVPAEPLMLQRTKPKLKPKHLAAQAAADQAEYDAARTDEAAVRPDDLAVTASAVDQTGGATTAAEPAVAAVPDGPVTATADIAADDRAIAGATTPEPSAGMQEAADLVRANAVLADAAVLPDAPDTGMTADLGQPVSASTSDNASDASTDMSVATTNLVAPGATTADDDGSDLTATAPTPGDAGVVSAPLAETGQTKGPTKLADAAFTRWPGWAQPDPDEIAAAALAPPEPPAAPVPVAADQRRKPKAAVQNLGWADRAEEEIHRRLAAELGPSVIGEVNAPALGLQLSEAALRDLVRDMIREELTGKLGERITQNVRKLVQTELQKSLSMHAAEFRSQRRDPG